LKIEKEYLEDHQVKLTVEIEQDTFERAKRIAARKIAKKIKVPGFRPGKAPYGVVLRQVGEANILEEAIEFLVDQEYPGILEEAEIEPYGPGTLQNVPELEPLTLEFVVPLDAEVELSDYQSISIPYEVPETTEEDVDAAVESARAQHAIRESVERPAEEGDTIFMRVSGKRTDVEDENDAVVVEERFSSSVIQDEAEMEWPFPGFSQELIGLSADDEKTIPYTFPDDYEDEDLQGVQVEYHVIVTNVQTQTLPEIDDELAETASSFETLEEWKTDIREQLEEQAEQSYAEEYDEQIIDRLIEECTVEFPPQMVEHEKDEMKRSLEYNLSRQGLNMQLYLQISGQDEEEFDEELTPVAEKRIKQALILMHIAEAEEIKADPDTVNQEVDRTFEAIASSMTPNEAKKLARSNYIPALASNIITDMLTQTTMDYLRATAKGEPWPPVVEEADEDGVENESPTEDEPAALDGESADPETDTQIEADTNTDEIEPEPEEDSAQETEEHPAEEERPGRRKDEHTTPTKL